jgi:AmpD protein
MNEAGMERLTTRPVRRISGDHWLERCRRVPTDNCEPRDDPADVELIVLHGISLPPGRFGGGHVEALFTNTLDTASHPSFASIQGVRVSAHLFIDRRGRVVQFVPFDWKAWHAGVSSWRGRCGCNRFSIGIELEGTDDHPYTRAQYGSLLPILRGLLARYLRLERDAIVGHQEIAPGRKTDPGTAFDWSLVYRELA